MDTTMPMPGHGHNSGNMLADQVDAEKAPALLHEAQELAGVVDAWAATVRELADEAEAQKARDLLAKLTAREKEIEETRKAEKEPHLAAGRAVDEKWRKPAALLAACKKPIQALLKGWLDREKARLAAEQAAAGAEAERLAREAEAARKAAEEQRHISAAVEAEAAEKRAAKAAATAQKAAAARPQVASASGGARRLTVRTTFRARMTSYPLAVRHYANHPEVVAVLEILASDEARTSRGTAQIPGFEIIAEEYVA